MAVSVGFFRWPTFQPRKCCAVNQWSLWRAALQHVDPVMKVGLGPFSGFLFRIERRLTFNGALAKSVNCRRISL